MKENRFEITLLIIFTVFASSVSIVGIFGIRQKAQLQLGYSQTQYISCAITDSKVTITEPSGKTEVYYRK